MRLVLIVLFGALAMSQVAGAHDATLQPAWPVKPDPSLCQVALRPSEEYLAGLYPVVRPSPTTPASALVHRGEPADQATIDGVTTTVLEWVACLNAGDLARAHSLWTVPAFLATIYAWAIVSSEEGAIDLADRIAQQPPLAPETASNAMVIANVHEVRQLADGRATAMVDFEDELWPGSVDHAAFVFVWDHGRWRIDDFGFVLTMGTPVAMTDESGARF